MGGYAFCLIGSPARNEAPIAESLYSRLCSEGQRVEIVNGEGDFLPMAASSRLQHDRSGGYGQDLVYGRDLIGNGASIIIPNSTSSREAYALARREVNSIEVFLRSGNASVGVGARGRVSHAGRGGVKNNGAPVEQPETCSSDLELDYDSLSPDECVDLILKAASERGFPDNRMVDNGHDDAKELELTILMPCLNEASAIGECISEAKLALEAANICGEVLVVDNGSTDGSADIARAAGARVADESRKGYGHAYLRGLQEARGKYIVMGDSDGTYDFSLVPQFRDLLREGYDFVNGSRIKGQLEAGAIPFLHRYIGVPFLTWMLNRLSGARFSDAHCGMRGFSREAVAKMGLRSPGMEFASEMILQAGRSNLRTIELPIPYRSRKGESKLRTFSDGWRHIRFMLLNSPTHLFMVPGVSLLVVGLLIMLALVGGKIEIAGSSFDIHYMVVGSMLAILGAQVAALGLSARLYARSIGLIRWDPLLSWGYHHLSLERGILAGSLVTVVGCGVLAAILAQWIAWGFSFQSAGMIRPALLGLTLVVLGVQTIFSAFFLSLLSMRRDTLSISMT